MKKISVLILSFAMFTIPFLALPTFAQETENIKISAQDYEKGTIYCITFYLVVYSNAFLDDSS